MGLRVDKELLKINARFLPALNVQYKQRLSKQPQAITPVTVLTRFASWNLKNVRFSMPKSCAQIQVILLIAGSKEFDFYRKEFKPWCAEWAAELLAMGLDNLSPRFIDAVQVNPGLTLDMI